MPRAGGPKELPDWDELEQRLGLEPRGRRWRWLGVAAAYLGAMAFLAWICVWWPYQAAEADRASYLARERQALAQRAAAAGWDARTRAVQERALALSGEDRFRRRFRVRASVAASVAAGVMFFLGLLVDRLGYLEVVLALIPLGVAYALGGLSLGIFLIVAGVTAGGVFLRDVRHAWL